MVKFSPLPSLEIPDVTVHDYILERIKEFGNSLALVSQGIQSSYHISTELFNLK